VRLRSAIVVSADRDGLTQASNRLTRVEQHSSQERPGEEIPMDETTDAKAAPGRRRDPQIEPKVTAAAIRVYAREGWNGFTFDAVAREASVGKPALYRRWASREELLTQALVTVKFPTARDCGSLRDDFMDYAHQWVDWYGDQDRGLAGMRLWPDCRNSPELREAYEEIIAGPRTRAARDITRRAINRGEIGPGMHSATIVELLIGAMNNHWAFTPDSKLDKLHLTFGAHAENLVDIILAGISAVAPPEPARTADVTAPRKRASRLASAGQHGGTTRTATKRAARKA
jgi:AcrR family transcriptional regulator